MAAVVGDHVGHDGGDGERGAGWVAVEFAVGAVEVGDEALAVVEGGVRAEVGLAGEVERRDARLVALAGGLLDEAQVGLDAVEGLDAADGAVAGDDALRGEGADGVEGAQGAGERAEDAEGGAAVEDDVAGDEGAPLRQPDEDVVRRVRGADVDQLQLEVARVEREALVEGDGRRRDDDLAPVDVGPRGPGCRGRWRSPPRGTSRGRRW